MRIELSAALRHEKADIKNTWKVVPFMACEMSFCPSVCELILGDNIPDANLWIQINSVQQPVKRNSVGSGNMSQISTSAFTNHLDYRFIVLKNTQRRFFMRTLRV